MGCVMSRFLARRLKQASCEDKPSEQLGEKKVRQEKFVGCGDSEILMMESDEQHNDNKPATEQNDHQQHHHHQASSSLLTLIKRRSSPKISTSCTPLDGCRCSSCSAQLESKGQVGIQQARKRKSKLDRATNSNKRKSDREAGMQVEQGLLDQNGNKKEVVAPTPETSNGEMAPDEVPAGKNSARLFTNVQQLCSGIIVPQLLDNISGERRQSAQSSKPQLLCLFLFGCQGSSKGEVAFELVQHSPLLGVLSNKSEPSEVTKGDCPLYHYIDVTSLIVANIDARIQEYQRLVALTSRTRRQQLSSLRKENQQQSSELQPQRQSSEEDKDGLNEGEDSGSAGSSSMIERHSLASSTSISSSSLDQGEKSAEQEVEQIFASLVTLTTKQRSILQLKLIKYANSVTAKWVFGLIQRQVEILEERLREKSASKVQQRVYLINLIPNQLSLFKSCLYLQQNLPSLAEFRHPYMALNFERRTNIRLMGKERAVNKADNKQQTNPDTDGAKPSLKLRLPRLGLSNRPAVAAAPAAAPKMQQNAKSLVPAATNALANSLNEKLGPKFNENFAQHFRQLDKLIKVRYNPTRDYNYANEQDDERPHSLSPSIMASSNGDAAYLRDQQHPTVRTSTSMQHLTDSAASSMQVQPDSSARGQRLSLTRFPPLSSESPQPLSADSRLCSTSSLLSTNTILAASSSESGLSNVGRQGAHLATRGRPPAPANGRPLSSVSLNAMPAVETTNSSQQQAPIKWAVELEMIDPSQVEDQQQQQQQQKQQQLKQAAECPPGYSTVIYSQKRSTTPRSPLAFAASSQQHKRAALAASYRLVPVRVAYANEQSCVRFEARRVHKRQLKLKSEADVARLWKLIDKVKLQVQSDCSQWLYEAISLHHNKLSSNNRVKRHSMTAATEKINAGMDLQLCTPALIVYTIKIDANRLQMSSTLDKNKPTKELDSTGKTAPQATNAEEKRPLIPILTLNDNRKSEVVEGTHESSSPEQAKRPASGRSTQSARPKRHVQFKLNQAPSNGARDNQFGADLDVRHRLWLDETSFISSNESNSSSLDPLALALRSRCK